MDKNKHKAAVLVARQKMAVLIEVEIPDAMQFIRDMKADGLDPSLLSVTDRQGQTTTMKQAIKEAGEAQE